MNKKKVLLIGGIVVLIVLVTYLAFNPAWITHPRYMIDSKYCKEDSECYLAGCSIVNEYNLKSAYVLGGGCHNDFCGSICRNNQCEPMECNLK